MTTHVRTFLEAVVQLERMHGLSIGHEDRHGLFIVRRHNKEDEAWLLDAMDNTESTAEAQP